MTLQASGAISLSQVQGEYGGSNPISMSEYYKDGAYVPSTVSTSFTATATSGSVVSSFGSRPGYDSGPTFNTASQLYTHLRWSNGGAQSATITMTLPAGTYTIYNGAFLQSSGQSLTYTIKVNGTQVAGRTRPYSNYGSQGDTNTIILTASSVVQIYNYQTALGNTWQANIVYVGGDSTGTRTSTLSATANTTVPTSGTISMAGFYNGKKTY